MDALTMEKILHLFIQGMEMISEGLQLALMQYQTKAEEDKILFENNEEEEK